jgi:ATP-dependent DNA helicase DinG
LLEIFRTLGNAVLFGTASFWEGVDVRGEALSVVMIEKLPFASPGDPVTRARIQAIETAGGNAFREHQLPQAVIALKQGVGRLIRDVEDTGVVMICDPRVTGSGYGKVFLSSLPKMPRTTELDEVVEFLSSHDALRVSA